MCDTVCVSVFVSVDKISPKILNRATSFLVEVLPLTQGGNHSILKKITMGYGWVCVCGGGGMGSKFGPNDKR